MSSGLSTYFLGLTMVGFDALWGSMTRSGAAVAIGNVKASGVLSSGGTLLRSYTGLASVDKLLLSPVIFYDSLMHNHSPVYRALLVSLFGTMQTTSFCMLVNGWEGGNRSMMSNV